MCDPQLRARLVGTVCALREPWELPIISPLLRELTVCVPPVVPGRILALGVPVFRHLPLPFLPSLAHSGKPSSLYSPPRRYPSGTHQRDVLASGRNGAASRGRHPLQSRR